MVLAHSYHVGFRIVIVGELVKMIEHAQMRTKNIRISLVKRLVLVLILPVVTWDAVFWKVLVLLFLLLVLRQLLWWLCQLFLLVFLGQVLLVLLLGRLNLILDQPIAYLHRLFFQIPRTCLHLDRFLLRLLFLLLHYSRPLGKYFLGWLNSSSHEVVFFCAFEMVDRRRALMIIHRILM